MLTIAAITCLCFLLTAALPSYYMDQHCGSTIALNTQPSRSFSLRLTSQEKYGSNMNCYVTVTGDEGSRIMTSFVWLDIVSFIHCPGDFVQIMDTEDVVGNITSSQNWTSSPVCGQRKPDVIMTSRSNSVTIRFISDGHFFGQGFHAVLTQFHYGPCHHLEFRCDNGRCIHADLRCSNNLNDTTSDNDIDHCGDFSHRRQCQDNNSSSFSQIIVSVVISFIVFVIAAFVLVAVARHRLRRHRYGEGEGDDEEGEEIPGQDEGAGDEAGCSGRARVDANVTDHAQRDVPRDSPSQLIFMLPSFVELLGTLGAPGLNTGTSMGYT